ncbi:anti-ECFsigma factor, ChrR [Obelidium mucronatum]|nr:anti-ECFsigma factor, ChrR [Obelidium mucronatum]
MQDKNDDLTQLAIQEYSSLQFVSSPTKGVWRGPLDRKGDEVARATTLVRFDPDAKFPYHVHDGGEEFLVLEGTFIDEDGVYPSGSYIRHPIGSNHAPWVGPEGCLILVKLRWMNPTDPLVVISNALDVSDGEEKVLFQGKSNGEHVAAVSILPGQSLYSLNSDGGLEVFVLSGQVEFHGKAYGKYDWIRLPPGFKEADNQVTSALGATLFVKRNHLA